LGLIPKCLLVFLNSGEIIIPGEIIIIIKLNSDFGSLRVAPGLKVNDRILFSHYHFM